MFWKRRHENGFVGKEYTEEKGKRKIVREKSKKS